MYTFTSTLHTAGGIDSVPEEAVARHGGAHDAGHAGPRVDARADHERRAGPVRHACALQAAQQGQRHVRYLRRVAFAWEHQTMYSCNMQ